MISHIPFWLRCMATLVRNLPACRYRLINCLGRSGRQFWTSMPSELGGYRFHCDLRDSIAREVCFIGRYEAQETALVSRLLGPSMTFVDVGANWGYFTLLAAHLVGPRGRIVSLEPDPRLFEILQRNVQHNGLHQVIALDVAAADRPGTYEMQGYDEREGNWGLSRLESAMSAKSPRFDVTAHSLDWLLNECEIGQVDLLKMDIEGAEALALSGMSDGLSQHRYRRILLEVHPTLLQERGLTVEEVLAPLVVFGYRGWRVDHSPRATRRAAYSRRLNPRDYVRPIDYQQPWDAWPHLLWILPELEASL